MNLRSFASARRPRWALAVLLLAGVVAGCTRTRETLPGPQTPRSLTIASQHDLRGRLISDG